MLRFFSQSRAKHCTQAGGHGWAPALILLPPAPMQPCSRTAPHPLCVCQGPAFPARRLQNGPDSSQGWRWAEVLEPGQPQEQQGRLGYYPKPPASPLLQWQQLLLQPLALGLPHWGSRVHWKRPVTGPPTPPALVCTGSLENLSPPARGWGQSSHPLSPLLPFPPPVFALRIIHSPCVCSAH